MNFAQNVQIPLYVKILQDLGFASKANQILENKSAAEQERTQKKRARDPADLTIDPMPGYKAPRPSKLKLTVGGVPLAEYNRVVRASHSDSPSIDIYNSCSTSATTVEWDSDYDEDLDNFE